MNILFACGGTAGHVNPAVALAKLFRQHDPDCGILFVGADDGMETRLVPKEGFDIRTVTISGFQRSMAPASIKHNFNTLLNMNKSKKQSAKILDEFKPDLAVGTGGYASFPIVKAAAARGIPTAVHESNAVPGLTTQALSKVVDLVMVGFEESRNHYENPEKVVVTGTPVRGDFFRYTKKEARAALGIPEDKPLVLSYWGSLGAEVMNGYMADFLTFLNRDGVPFRHIHGAGRDYAALTGKLKAAGVDCSGANGLEVREYIYDMPTVMTAADLVLCRAGASTLAELSAIGKPAVLVPSPNVTADHQTKNARVLSSAGGAILMPEAECSAESLYHTTAELLSRRDKLEEMSRSLKALGTANAAEQIYEALLKLLH